MFVVTSLSKLFRPTTLDTIIFLQIVEAKYKFFNLSLSFLKLRKTRKFDMCISDAFFRQEKTSNRTDSFETFLFPLFFGINPRIALRIDILLLMHNELSQFAPLIANFHNHFSTSIHEQFQYLFWRKVYAITGCQNILGRYLYH